MGPILIQLPPSLVFDRATAVDFFDDLRPRVSVMIVCEPRHPTWFAEEAVDTLEAYDVRIVDADPAVVATTDSSAQRYTWRYSRLHGTPRVYYSSYDKAELKNLAAALKDADDQSWCIFDNTAAGAAFENALDLKNLLRPASRGMLTQPV